MKKICFLLFVLAVIMSGCGKRPVIGMCVGQDAAYSWVERGLKARLEKKGYLVKTKHAGNDQFRQNQQVEELLEEDCDLLILEPVMASATEQLLEKAKEEDVATLLLNVPVEEEILDSYEDAYYIGSDLARPGELQSEMICQLPNGGDINGDGVVMYTVISGPEDHIDAMRWTLGCITAMDGICLEVDHGGWEQQEGNKLCQRQLSRVGNQMEVVFCGGEKIALGALEALTASNQTVEGVYLVGIGEDSRVLREIRNNRMIGTIVPDIRKLSDCATDTAVDILAGISREKVQIVDYLALTKKNVDAYEKEKTVW